MNDAYRNQVFSWGAGEHGQLGQAQRKSAAVAARIDTATGNGTVQVAVGTAHVVLVSASGLTYTSGDNEHGALSKGDTTRRTTPRLVTSFLTSAVRVLKCAAGAQHTLWLTEQGVFAAGANHSGQLGLGDDAPRTVRTALCVAPNRLAAGSVFDVACGNAVSAALLLSGAVLTWGAARHGLLAHGADPSGVLCDLRLPTIVDVLAEERVKCLVFGTSHALALVAPRDEYDHTRVLAWGDNSHGQLGVPDIKTRLLPRNIETLSLAGISHIAAGNYHSCAIADGTLYVWGGGHHGQLGLGRDVETIDVPRPLTNLFAKPVRRVECGALHTIVLCCDREPEPFGADDGRQAGDTHVYTFGFNRQWQLGVGHNSNQNTPQRNAVFDKYIVQQIAAGGNTSAALVRAPPPIVAHSETLSMLVASWNVNASDCQRFGAWLECDVPPDIVVVGLQEIVDLDFANVTKSTAGSAKLRAKEKASAFRDKLRSLRRGNSSAPSSTSSTSSASSGADAGDSDDDELDQALGATGQRWQAAVQAELVRLYSGDCAHYVPLATKRLVGVWMCVFARAPIAARCTGVATATCSVGILNRVGNKGAVAIRMRIADTTLCFVCSHLAAGDGAEALEKRCVDYSDICAGLQFAEGSNADGAVSIYDHQRLVWLGDLNFRLTGLEREHVFTAVRNNDLAALLAADELLQIKQRGRVFADWTEQPITFLPTYKYDAGTDHYDTSHKARLPAWCDRVLVKGDGFEPVYYLRYELLDSDHRPVAAYYRCRVDSHTAPPPVAAAPSAARVPTAAAVSIAPILPAKKMKDVPPVPPKKTSPRSRAESVDTERGGASDVGLSTAVADALQDESRLWRHSMPVVSAANVATVSHLRVSDATLLPPDNSLRAGSVSPRRPLRQISRGAPPVPDETTATAPQLPAKKLAPPLPAKKRTMSQPDTPEPEPMVEDPLLANANELSPASEMTTTTTTIDPLLETSGDVLLSSMVETKEESTTTSAIVVTDSVENVETCELQE
jgi:alpha-tubulin suppressor-like RCC1 family protein